MNSLSLNWCLVGCFEWNDWWVFAIDWLLGYLIDCWTCWLFVSCIPNSKTRKLRIRIGNPIEVRVKLDRNILIGPKVFDEMPKWELPLLVVWITKVDHTLVIGTWLEHLKKDSKSTLEREHQQSNSSFLDRSLQNPIET